MSTRSASTSRIATGRSIATFSPLSIANCELWLDAANTDSVTLVSSAVSQWNDLSGNNRHATQGTANNRPTYADSVNGKKVLTFDGTNDSLITGLASATISGYVTMFCVCRPTSSWTAASNGTSNNKTPLFARNADASSSWGMVLQWQTSNTGGRLSLNYQWRGIGFNYSTGPRVSLGALQVLAVRLSASDSDQRASGSSSQYPATLTSGTGGASDRYLTVGEDPTQSRYWSDYVAEVIVYSRSLAASEVLSVESYLINKWGITRQ